MATRDFRSQQIRITQIIASGTNPTEGPSLLIYSASDATNDQGATDPLLTAGAGSDTWLFISGSQNTSDGKQVLFGGNIATSGSLTSSLINSMPEAPLKLRSDSDIHFFIDSDNNQNSAFKFFAGGTTSAENQIANLNEDGNLQIDGDLHLHGHDIRNSENEVVISIDNDQDTTLARHLILPSDIIHTADPDTKISFTGENEITVKVGDIDTFQATTAGLIVNPANVNHDFSVRGPDLGGGNLSRIIFADAQNNTIKFFDNDDSNITETDVNFKVFGQKDTRGTTTRGTALFTGDLVVSGTLYADRQVVEVDLVQSGSELILSSAIHFKNSGPGAGGNFPVPLNDGSLFVSTGSIHAKLRNSTGVEEIRLQEYTAGNGITVTSGSHSDRSTFHLSVAALTGSALGAHELHSSDLLAIADVSEIDDRTRKMTLETFSDTMAGRGLITRASSSLSGPGLMTNDGIVAHLTGSEFNGPVGVTGSLGVVGDLSLELANKLYFKGKGSAQQAYSLGNGLVVDAYEQLILLGDTGIQAAAGTLSENAFAMTITDTTFNKNSNNVNFHINTDNYFSTFFVDGGDNSVIVGAETFTATDVGEASDLLNKGYGDDVKILLSGSSGAKLAGTRGVVVVPGDLVTSGTNYFEDTQITGSLQASGSIALEIHKPLYFNGLGGDISIVGSGSVSDGVAGPGKLTIDADDSLLLRADSQLRVGIGGHDSNHEHSANLEVRELERTVFNFYTNDVDFVVNTDDYRGTFFVDGNDNTVIIGAQNFDSSPAASELSTKGYTQDVKILLSGTVGSKNTSTRGVVVAAGDMVVSGGLYDGAGLHYLKNANEGLFNNSGTAQLNINTLTTSGTPHQDDSFAFIDANDSNITKKGTIEDLSTAIAGDGLSQVAKQLQVNVDDSTIERNSDAIRVKDSGITAAKIATAVAGTGLTGGGGAALAVNTGNGLIPGPAGNGVDPTHPLHGDRIVVDDSIVATLSGSTFQGQVNFLTSITGSTDLHIGGEIIHKDDIDTKIRFSPDGVTFMAGGTNTITTSTSAVTVNASGNADLDFRVETANDSKIINVNSEFDYISIGDDAGHNASTGVQSDNHLFVSGAIGGITDAGKGDGSPGGVAVFGGDIVVSGTIYDANHNGLDKKSFDENGSFSSTPNATGTDAVAIGNNTVASGNRSLALGSTSTGTNTAAGLSSVVLGGEDCQIASAASYSAILGGLNNEITAGGEYGVIMGEQNTVSAARSVAIGKGLIVPVANTIALGNNDNTAAVVASGSLKVNADATFRTNVAITGSLEVGEYIRHIGDEDTAIHFLNDKIRLQVGTKKAVKVNTDSVLILSGGNSAATFEGDGNDVAFYVSGSKSSQGTTTRGTSLFGGDVHISGALSGPSQYALTDNTVRVFRDGNTMKFSDGDNAARSLSQLAAIGVSTVFFEGVHGDDSNPSKVKTTGSVAFSGNSDDFVDGLLGEGVGNDVFVFFSGSIGSKDGAVRGVTLFGGDTVFSGSTGFTDVAAANNIVATGSLIAGGNVIKNSNGDSSIHFNSSNKNVFLGDAEFSTAQSLLDIRKNDDQQFVDGTDGNTFANYNIALRNHSTTANAFAGIAFDVQDNENADQIGASIIATRDSSANGAQHKANLLFNTNDNAEDDLKARMIIDYSGSVGIGRTNPIGALHVDGGDFTVAGNQGSAQKHNALTVDYSSGRVGIHTAHADATDKLTITGDNTTSNGAGGNNTLSVNVYNNSGDADIVIRKAKGTIASPTAIQQANNIGGIYFEGYDGSDFEPAAAIKGTIDNNLAPGSDDMPGNLRFYTTADGASSLTEHLRINAGGQIMTPNGAWVGQNSEKVLFQNTWNIGTAPKYQLGLYNGNSQHIAFAVDANGDVGVKFQQTSDKLSISGSLEVMENLGFFNSNGSANGVTVNTILDEDNMSSNSNTALATQQSIKAYVDSSTPTTLGAIGNVNTTDVTKAAGHVLIWDNSNTRWENAAITGTTNEVDITLGDGSVQVGLPNDVTLTGNLDVGGSLAVGNQASTSDTGVVAINNDYTMTSVGPSSLSIKGAITTNNNADRLLNSTTLALLNPDSVTLAANTERVSTLQISEPKVALSGNSLASASTVLVTNAPTEASGDFLHPSGSTDFHNNFAIKAESGRSSFASGSFGLYTSRTDQLIYESVDSSFDSGLAGVFAAGFDNDVPATRNQLGTYDGLNTAKYAISLNGTVAQKSFDQIGTQTIYRSFASSQSGGYVNFNPGVSPEGKVKSFTNTFYKVPGGNATMGVPLDIKGTVSDASSTLEVFFVAGSNGMDTGEQIYIHFVTDTGNFATAHNQMSQRTQLSFSLYVDNGSGGWTGLGTGTGVLAFFEPYDDIGTSAVTAKWMKLVITDHSGGSLQSLQGLLFENRASSSGEIFRIANMHVLHTGNSTQLAHSTDGSSNGFNTAIELTHDEQKGRGAAFRTVYVLAGKGDGTKFNRQYAGDDNKMLALGDSDGLVIQFSLDGGSTYFTPHTNWYKSSITGGPPSFIEDVAGSSSTWAAQSTAGKLLGSEMSATDYEWFAFNLPSAGPDFDEVDLTNFRMRMACDSSTEGAGLAISDIRVSRYAQGGLNISSDSDNNKAVISCDNGSSDVEFSSRGYNSEHSTVTWLKYDASIEKALVNGTEVFTPAFISVTATETSDSLTGNKTVFHKDNYPDDNISFDQHVAQGITYDNTTGRFTVDKAGTYEVTFVGILEGHSTGCDLQIYVNGSEEVQITTQVHTVVDPVERTIHGMFAVADGGYFQILVQDASGGTFNTGSTINIKRIA